MTVFEQMNAISGEDRNAKRDHIASKKWFYLVRFPCPGATSPLPGEIKPPPSCTCGKPHKRLGVGLSESVGIVVMLNAVIIGLEIDHGRGDDIQDRLLFFLLECCCSTIFFCEMVIRQHQLGWDYFLDPWNVLDYSLVVLSLLDVSASLSEDKGSKMGATLRIVRLLRIVRNVRLVRIFHRLWLLVRGLFDSLQTLLWVSLLILMVAYTVAVFLVLSVGQHPQAQEQWGLSQQYVGTVPRSMLTVIQVITLDQWAADIVRPMSKIAPWTTWLMIGTIIVCTYGMLNVIVAVIVEKTMAVAKENENTMQKINDNTEKRVLEKMADDFRVADADGNVELDRREFKKLMRSQGMQHRLHLLGIRVSEAEELFDLMDIDHNNTISAQEFLGGVKRLRGPAKGAEMVQLIAFAQRQARRAGHFIERVRKLNKKCMVIEKRLDQMLGGTTDELYERMMAQKRQVTTLDREKQRNQIIAKLDYDRATKFPTIQNKQQAVF